ncbi:tRNA (N6-threonylcarbamoyladenosine(37)-N6)-methyltransferase TrmO [Paludibaculum fermentans]|uniref:tRNA (N6-threonylcarbamoyladenosine(37)-N6)-methyltransferase TrmO n=1 Tax=Paludibaculum fermentans TaxID=1473598 RepID=UPI003EBA0A8A
MSVEFAVRPVGYVRSEVLDRKAMPTWGATAAVEILPEFADALLKIEKHSHLWIFGWLGQGRDERHVLQVIPRGYVDRSPSGLHGVFAVRSPARPNPIGLTAARVIALDGLTIRLDRLDFMDGTPVLDIKPYLATRDIIFSTNYGQLGQARTREDLRNSLMTQAVQFHGQRKGDLALAVRIIEHYRATRFELGDPGHYPVTAPIDRPVLLDGLMGITRSTPGRGNLHFGPSGLVQLGGITYRLIVPDTADAEKVLHAPEETLFDAS